MDVETLAVAAPETDRLEPSRLEGLFVEEVFLRFGIIVGFHKDGVRHNQSVRHVGLENLVHDFCIGMGLESATGCDAQQQKQIENKQFWSFHKFTF
ncbi:MAG: hypothetical protein J5725_12300 [Bacteroidales bacterium]|nr:hypothetical protein [Bacteroidales bacterium]